MPVPRKSLSKAEKSLVFVCLFAVLPLAAVVFVASGRDAEPKWDISPVPTPPNPNGYDLYVAAAKATIRFKPEVAPASDTKGAPPNSFYASKNYSLGRRQQWLKANTRTFDLVKQGITTPSLTPQYNSSNSNGDWSTLRQLARDMSVRTRTLQMQKQPMRATMSALDGLQMGQDITHGGNLMARLVAIAIGAISRSPLEDLNKTINSLSDSEARLATRRLEALLAHEPTAAQTLTIEKRDILIDMQKVFAEKGWRELSSPQGSVPNCTSEQLRHGNGKPVPNKRSTPT